VALAVTTATASPASARAFQAPPAPNVLGSTLAREFTPPLVQGPPGPCGCGCALSPDTSLGFAFEIFCSDIANRPLDPWQRWLGIHGLELLPDGRPRFRQVLVLVARQNGKTEMLVLLSLFWMHVLCVGLILGTSTKLDYARESWMKVETLARSVSELWTETAQVRSANGEQEIITVGGSRYKIAASNEEGGRSLTVARLIEDEIRQHHDWSAHNAAKHAMNAVPDGQAWAISNAGDDRSVVLNALQEQALTFINTGLGDYRLGYFGYTAPDGCACDDLEALAMANPNLGRRVDAEALLSEAIGAMLAGGEQEAGFRTEAMCQHVPRLKPQPLTLTAWNATAADVDPDGPPVFFVTMARQQASATINVAAMHDGKPHVELAEHAPGVMWLAGRLRQLNEKHPGARFAAWAAGPVKAWKPTLAEPYQGPNGEMLPGLELELLNTTDASASCAYLESLVGDAGCTHSPDPIYVASLKGAEIRHLDGGSWTWDWKASTADLAPISGAGGALWLLARDDVIVLEGALMV
jgi:Phage Terminase